MHMATTVRVAEERRIIQMHIKTRRERQRNYVRLHCDTAQRVAFSVVGCIVELAWAAECTVKRAHNNVWLVSSSGVLVRTVVNLKHNV